MPKSLLIVDDFLANPDAARNAALNLRYDPAAKQGNYPGLLSDRPLVIGGLEAEVSGILGEPLVAVPGTSHLHTRITLRGDKGVTGPHIDPAVWSGILYLTQPGDCRGGTDFFRHRRTGLDRIPRDANGIRAAGYDDVNRLIEEVVNQDTFKPSRWERTMTVPMRYNRLVLFNPWMFHDAAPGFGDRAERGRLVALMFLQHA